MIFRRSGAAKPKPAAYQTLLYHKQAAFVKERRGGTAAVLKTGRFSPRLLLFPELYVISGVSPQPVSRQSCPERKFYRRAPCYLARHML